MTDNFHWYHFAEFCKYEIASGGPDPQIPLVAEMSKDCSWEERVWRAGCYMAVYNVPTAEAIWREWPLGGGTQHLEDWLQENWRGIATRPERRSVRTPKKLAECLRSYAIWTEQFPLPSEIQIAEPHEAYEFFWDSADSIRFVGRYAKLKLLDCYYQFCELPIKPPDIRPKGAWSPRGALQLLFPERAEGLGWRDESPESLELVNRTVDDAIAQLEEEGIRTNYNTLQIMLCEYREAFESLRQHPGHSHDSELDYHNKISPWWGEETDMFRARATIFPHEHLGEIQGWPGKRKELGRTLRDFGYIWTDLRFDYRATTDLANPVKR